MEIVNEMSPRGELTRMTPNLRFVIIAALLKFYTVMLTAQHTYLTAFSISDKLTSWPTEF